MSDGTTLTLGDIEFTGVEMPEGIPWGTNQQLAVQRQVGGARTIDSMGVDYDPIEWSGWFVGPDAETRAKLVDAMAASGLPQTLAWSSFKYQVIVRSFRPVYERFYQIPYRIVLEVQSNDVQPVTSSATPSLDDAISTDNQTADTLVTSCDDPTLSMLMANVDTMIAAA